MSSYSVCLSGFLFPEDTPEEDKRVCDGEKKLFCKDYVNNAEIMFILASVSAFLVILSLVRFLGVFFLFLDLFVFFGNVVYDFFSFFFWVCEINAVYFISYFNT